MQEIVAYKCKCGHIYENKIYIRKCNFCGKEICGECAWGTAVTCFKCGKEHEKCDYKDELMRKR